MTTENQAEVSTAHETTRHGIEPVEVAVLLSVIFDGVSQIRPDLQMILTSRGIDGDKFSQDVRQMVSTMITVPETRWEERK